MSTLLDLVNPKLATPALVEAPTLATIGSARELSRAQLLEAAKHVSGEFPASADAFAVSMRNSFEFVVSFLGIVGRGAVIAPLNPQTTQKEAEEVCIDAKVKCVVVDDEKSGAALAAKQLGIPLYFMTKSFEVRPVNEQAKKATSSKAAGDKFPKAAPNDVALYLFTSGTTSKPKLVPLTHYNMIVSILNIRNHYELGVADRTYCVMPLFHIHGLQSAVFATLAGGGTIILPEEGKFSASVFWRDVVTFGATWYTAVPTMHQILLSRADQDKDWISKNQLRFIRSCSSSLAPAVLESLEKTTGRPVLEAYAMTEAAHQMTSNPLPKHGPRKPGSVGRATNVQLKIEGSKDKAGAIGEVCIRGDNVMAGYINRPEANAEAFDKEGWFRTGDLGYLDQDGYLFLAGRIKEIVNRGGEKISPPEIDAALLEMPGIGEAVSFGMPSAKYGEELYAAVVKKAGFAGELNEQDILKNCASRLARVKVPTRVFIVSAIPKSATGKIQRKNLSAHFAKEIAPAKL